MALGGERITGRMIIGGLAILAAMYLVEVAPQRRRRRTAEPTEADERKEYV